ncbi:MAG: ORF6N domain-containing protein [Bryobacteraceae bacterium]
MPVELIGRKIYAIRGQKVMLDADLAELYEVETKALNRAVKRNVARFPIDFMYQLTVKEAANLRYHFGTSSLRHGGRRYAPYAFTEHGVAMLSSVLNSERAVQMNILIVRAFVKLRDVLATNKELALQIERLAHNQKDQALTLSSVVDQIERRDRKVMRELNPALRRKAKIGFITGPR